MPRNRHAAPRRTLCALVNYNIRGLFKNRVTFYFSQKIFIYSSISVLSLSKKSPSDIIHLCQRFFPIFGALMVCVVRYGLGLVQRCGLYLLNLGKPPSLHGSFQFWKQKNVAGGESGEYGG